jgi:hypothetical protein
MPRLPGYFLCLAFHRKPAYRSQNSPAVISPAIRSIGHCRRNREGTLLPACCTPGEFQNCRLRRQRCDHASQSVTSHSGEDRRETGILPCTASTRTDPQRCGGNRCRRQDCPMCESEEFKALQRKPQAIPIFAALRSGCLSEASVDIARTYIGSGGCGWAFYSPIAVSPKSLLLLSPLSVWPRLSLRGAPLV